MKVRSLKLANFRNYESLDCEFSDGINIFYGDNAQGKTNLLEAVFVAATTKSHRGSKDREMIRLGCEDSHIRLILEKKDVLRKIDMHFKKNNPKGAAIDGIMIRKSADLYGLLHVISFAPEDLAIIKNGPSERRRFLDMELCQLDRVYLSNLISYNRVLMQRNNLLKQAAADRSLIATIDVWNEQLVNYGSEIIKSRQVFIEEIKKIIEKKHRQLSGGSERLEMRYIPSVSEDQFKDRLEKELERELFLKATNSGPHKDDVEFLINGNNVRVYGSQGQKRSVALSLKFSEIELVKNKINDMPVLLLDDVLSELDRSRQQSLLEETKGIQTFITCTGLEEFVEKQREGEGNRLFHIVNGNIFSEG